MKTQDLLVEIGTEELPPKSLQALSDAFSAGIVTGLQTAGLRHGVVHSFATPRRLAVLIRRVTSHQADQVLQRKGPPVSASFTADGLPTRAATAFAESCGVALAALTRINESKGEFLFYTGVKPGAPTASLLAGIVQESLAKLPIAKRMRWGSGTAEFVRPVHWIVLMFGRDVVPAHILGVDTGHHTRGHRFMSPGEIALSTPSAYANRLLKKGCVVADFATRREQIRTSVTALAQTEGGEAIISDALLDEVTALVEWPVPVLGRFEERFLSLPPEVLIATLQDHQRYFPVKDRNGQLSRLFITVANIASLNPDEVRAGNERVVRPRLADAVFFWDNDCKESLLTRREQLKAVTFQAQLGSYFTKSERVKALALTLAQDTGADREEAARAASIAKCDLLTGLVGEFPELQGTMGGYYARHDQESEAIATAIAEQYLPRFAGDVLPSSKAGLTLALADKLDTIVGIFAIGQKPSGTKDPYALRRLSLGVLRILLEKRIELNIPLCIRQAFKACQKDIAELQAQRTVDPKKPTTVMTEESVVVDVYDYLFERLRSIYLESGTGITADMFDAVLALRPTSPLDFDSRLRALSEFLKMPAAAALASANKRSANILKKAAGSFSDIVRDDLLENNEERQLSRELAAVTPRVEAKVVARDYAAALTIAAELRPAVDAFFEQVMVMAEDPAVRANRLCLLANLRQLFLAVADLSRLPG
jgi:glycyl-tRNA synthetase beta chain